MESTVGLIATLITVVYTCLGLPAQILKNHRKKSVEGISLFMAVMLFSTFSSWVVYAVVTSNIFILVSNATGGFCAGVILVQFVLFRKKL